MEMKVLRSEKKGYKKDDVMMKLDQLNVLIMGVQDGSISKADACNEAQLIAETPMKTAFFDGFHKEDTDNYIRELLDYIAAL
jgi:hypothetical protein